MACSKQGPRPDWAPHDSKLDFEGIPRQRIVRRSRLQAWFGPRGWEGDRNVRVSGSDFSGFSDFTGFGPGMVRNGLGRPWGYYLGVPGSKKLKKYPAAAQLFIQ